MSTPKAPLSREERLAAKLRENLRRRKEQAREQVRGPEPRPAAEEALRALPKDEASG